MKKCSSSNSVGPILSGLPEPVTVRVAGLSTRPSISTASLVSCGARRRSTAWMRASSSRGEKGLVT